MTPDTINRLEEWLRAGPRDAPDRVLPNVVREVDTTPQEGRSWVSATARFVTAGAVGAAGIAAVIFALWVDAMRDEAARPGSGGHSPTAAAQSTDCRIVLTVDTPNGGRQDVSPPYGDVVASHSAELGVLVNSVEIRALDSGAWG